MHMTTLTYTGLYTRAIIFHNGSMFRQKTLIKNKGCAQPYGGIRLWKVVEDVAGSCLFRYHFL